MYYLIEQDPNQKEFIVFKSDDLKSAMERKLEMECQTHNKFCNYFILEFVSVEKRQLALETIKNEFLSQI